MSKLKLSTELFKQFLLAIVFVTTMLVSIILAAISKYSKESSYWLSNKAFKLASKLQDDIDAIKLK